MRGLRGFFPAVVIAVLGVTFVFESTALAQGAGAAGGAPAWVTFAPIIFAFIVMMFLSSRQNTKRKKEQEQLMSSLKRGDQVLTNSGMLGRIEGIAEQFITLEVADGVRIKILKNQIAGPANLSEAKS